MQCFFRQIFFSSDTSFHLTTTSPPCRSVLFFHAFIVQSTHTMQRPSSDGIRYACQHRHHHHHRQFVKYINIIKTVMIFDQPSSLLLLYVRFISLFCYILCTIVRNFFCPPHRAELEPHNNIVHSRTIGGIEYRIYRWVSASCSACRTIRAADFPDARSLTRSP